MRRHLATMALQMEVRDDPRLLAELRGADFADPNTAANYEMIGPHNRADSMAFAGGLHMASTNRW